MTQPNINEQIIIDTSDEDSQYEVDSLIDSNMSFASSVRDYTYENGRRYHAYRHGQYPMPNDEQEQLRLDMQHHLVKLVIGGNLGRAPILTPPPPPADPHQRDRNHHPERILDLGTGTGIWALDMAEEFPHAEIIGVDLSPIQPNWVPPNCRFFVDDCESEWTFGPDEQFDYIHARSMAGGICDWPRLLKQAYQHLKPGGWVELQEFDFRVLSDDGTHRDAVLTGDWLAKLREASVRFGKSMDVAPHCRRWMEEVGFVNATDDIYKVIIGTWPKDPRLKEIGRVGRLTLSEGIEPYTLALFTRVLGYTPQEARDVGEKVREELMNPSLHLYVPFYYTYGQKPLE